MSRNWCIKEGHFVCVTIQNLPVTFLIDTGSNITILSRTLMERLPPDVTSSVQATKTKMLTVTREATPFLGKTEQELSIEKQKIKHTLLVADIENEGILGMDFSKAHKCDLVLTRQILKVNGEEILCFANSRNAQSRCCRVAVLGPVEISPGTEMIVPGYTKGIIDRSGTGQIEADTKFLHSKGLLIAKALVCPTTGTVLIRIANPNAQSKKISNEQELIQSDPPSCPQNQKEIHVNKYIN